MDYKFLWFITIYLIPFYLHFIDRCRAFFDVVAGCGPLACFLLAVSFCIFANGNKT